MNKKGFTLIELLLSLALLAIIFSFSVPFFGSLQRNNLEIEVKKTVSYLRHAKVLSQVAHQDSSWGVNLENDRFILFAGDNYNNRDRQFDQVFYLENNINFLNQQEIVFSKFTGELNSGKEININSENDTWPLYINELGVIHY